MFDCFAENTPNSVPVKKLKNDEGEVDEKEDEKSEEKMETDVTADDDENNENNTPETPQEVKQEEEVWKMLFFFCVLQI